MPFVAVPSVKLGVTVKPPSTALSSFRVNVILSPSSATAAPIVTAAVSSSKIVPVTVSGAVTVSVDSVLRLTVNVSSASAMASSVVATVRVVWPALPK